MNNKEGKKKKIDFEKELDKIFTFSEDEKDLILENIDEFKQDNSYELLKRKFYHELEGYDLEIAIIKDKISSDTKHYEEVIEDLKKEKQKLIDSTGFIFDFKEDLK